MDLVNDRDADGNIARAAPTFDYIENKAIEEEHRKGQLGKQPAEAQALPALALIRGPGDKKLIPSSDGTTCRIEIDNVPYCSFCRKPYHVDSECFSKNPRPKDQRKEGKGHRIRAGSSHTGAHPKKPTFVATKASEEDVNTAFRNNVEGNLAMFGHTLTMMATKTLPIRDAWIVDSGCAQHVCNSTSRFVRMDKYHGPPLRSVDASTTPSGVGTVNILCNVRGRRKWLVLDNVLFVRSAHANLISVLQLLKRGAKVEFSSQGASICNKSNWKNLYTASQYQGVYALDLWTHLTFPAYHVSPQMTLWHNRLAHMSDANLRRLKKQAYGIRDVEPRQPCNPCLQGRMVEKPHNCSRRSRRGEYPMELLHIDVAGPFDEGLDGSRYWLTIVDDFAGWIEVIPIPRRQEFVVESLRFFLDHNERPERKCRRIRLDRIPEQVGEEMRFMFFSRAIQAEVTGVDQHQQNGVAERAHKTIYDRVGPTLAYAKLSTKFWPEIARTAAFLSNRSPSSRLKMTPYQIWYGDKPDLSRLRVIGSRGEYLTPPKQRKKLTEPRTKPCVLLGYEGNTNYRILLEDGRIIGTPNAEFHEVLITPSAQTMEDVGVRRDGSPEAMAAAAGGSETVGLINQPSPSNHDSQAPIQSSDDNSQPLPRQTDDYCRGQAPSQPSDDDSQPVAEQGDRTLSPIRSDDTFGPFSDAPNGDAQRDDSLSRGDQQRDEAQQGQSSGEWQRHPELRLDRPVHSVQEGALLNHPELQVRVQQTTQDTLNDSEEELMLMSVPEGKVIPTFLTVAAEETEPFEPKTVQQAKNDASWPEWEIGMIEEVNSHKQNKTWVLVDPPKDRRILSGKWVYKLKRGPHGEVTRYKCRWVVRGFTQEEGIDYDETFASVVKPMSYKALFAIAAALGLEIEQMDVKTAFLYGDIDHEIYVEQPHHMTDGTPRVCKLRKALYGLKQAPRIWYQTLTNFLRGLGFEPINADLGIFVRSNVYIAVYVDDLLIVGPSIAEIKKIKRSLRNRFQMTDLGPCSYYLGMSIQRDQQNRILHLSQEAYIDKIIHQFGMDDCKPVNTPIETSPLPENVPEYTCTTEQRIEYQRIVGSLMYIMLGTRGDIAYAVSVASRYLVNPGPQHMKLARRVLRYLKGTKTLRLTYKGSLHMLRGFTDADWAGCRDTRRSTAGYLFNIGSGAISWQSKRQSIVALSTCEAEFIGQTQATKEAIWLRRLLHELNVSQGKTATIICGDNQGAIALSSNPQYHSRTKHMEIQRKWQGEVQEVGTVKLKYVPTTEQIADGFTKPLARDRFEWFRRGLGIE
ncbi:Integrase catalytic core [Macrophomina phaseolina MS6]|uniref:Integrase catalytic core n=1 Tax=Macrophomina phaseolina (strain MS6) TaxID=1126212 RepID=K2R9C2_MACPH|nr:Integrase catalytic core [Macrophomina phaseolina MS6]